MDFVDKLFQDDEKGGDMSKNMKNMNPFYFFDKFAETQVGSYVMLFIR